MVLEEGLVVWGQAVLVVCELCVATYAHKQNALAPDARLASSKSVYPVATLIVKNA